MCAVDGSPALLECPDTCDARDIAAALGIDLSTAAASGATTDAATAAAATAGSTSISTSISTSGTSSASGSGEPPQSAFTTAVAGQIIDRCACTVTKLMDGTTTWQNVYPCVVATTKQVTPSPQPHCDPLSSPLSYSTPFSGPASRSLH